MSDERTGDSGNVVDLAARRRELRAGRKTVLTAHMQLHLPQHVREWVRRTMDEYHRQRSMPPRYREQLEHLYREASEREKKDGEETP